MLCTSEQKDAGENFHVHMQQGSNGNFHIELQQEMKKQKWRNGDSMRIQTVLFFMQWFWDRKALVQGY